MPTDAEIFAGANKDLMTDNIIQVARTHRNKDIVELFNADRTTDKIHVSTVGARISRGLDAIADRDGTDRAQLKQEFEAERAKNGVAGRNQHTIVGRKPQATPAGYDEDAKGDATASPKARDESRAAKKPRLAVKPGHSAQRRDSVVGPGATSSPLLQKGKRTARPATGPPKSVAGKKRDRAEDGEGEDAGSQQGSKPRKAANTMSSGSRSSSSLSESSASASAPAAASQGGNGAGGDGGDSPGSDSSSSLGTRSPTPSPPEKRKISADDADDEDSEPGSPGPEEVTRRLERQLDDAETDAAFADQSLIHDDAVLAVAKKRTIPAIIRAANRAAGRLRHSPRSVDRRIRAAVNRMAERRQVSPRRMSADLASARRASGITRDGMDLIE